MGWRDTAPTLEEVLDSRNERPAYLAPMLYFVGQIVALVLLKLFK